MRFAGIDVGSQTHVVAIVGEEGKVLVKPTSFGEDAAGYEKLFTLLGSSEDLLIAMEATGHYGWNLSATLHGKSFKVALLNPLRTRRFAEEDLARAKTDTIDALGIARFSAQKRPPASSRPDVCTGELRELVRFYDRLVQDFGDRIRQLHRLVDLGFPELTTVVRTLDSQRAMTILREYPTAVAFDESCLEALTALRYDGRHTVGPVLAQEIIGLAARSVGRHHGSAYANQVQWLCQDLERLRRHIRSLRSEIEKTVRSSPLGVLLLSINVLGVIGAAHIMATVGDPCRRFRDGAAFAAYVGVVPGTSQSGLRRSGQARLCPLGNADLRKALWMVALRASYRDPWLRAYYQRLTGAGKRPKVALVAVLRKLLTAVYSVCKNNKPYIPGRSMSLIHDGAIVADGEVHSTTSRAPTTEFP